MKEFLGYLLMVILTLIGIVVLLQIHHEKNNAQLCFDSKWKTREFEIVNNKLYCKTDNGMQMLKWREM